MQSGGVVEDPVVPVGGWVSVVVSAQVVEKLQGVVGLTICMHACACNDDGRYGSPSLPNNFTVDK